MSKALVGLMVVAIIACIAIYIEKSNECHNSGGQYVKTLFSYTCIK